VQPPPDDGTPKLLYKEKLWTLVPSSGDTSTEEAPSESDDDGDEDAWGLTGRD
jgi:hypothetical protein